MNDASRTGTNELSPTDLTTATPALCDSRANEGFDRSPPANRQPRPHVSPWSFVVHSHLRWDFVWQRPQQLLSRLAAHGPVLFLEEPMAISDPPRLDITEPHANVVRVVPQLPPALAAVDAQSAEILRLLRPALKDHPLLAGRFHHPIQWFYSPMAAPIMLDQFDARCVVYDCMDELANFRFAPADIVRREQLLLAKADVVFTGGYQLYQSKARYHRNVHFYGCGVDIHHFGQARRENTPVAAEVAHLPRPVLGYYGVIDERLDYALIDHLATALPQASVVMVGPRVKVEEEALPRRANLHWLGQRGYAELPALVKGFDVCLMPFALNEATQFINPTKTLEYMAAGKPIVSTAVADVVRHFTPIVDVVHSASEFVGAVERAYRKPNPERIQHGIERAHDATWEATVAAMRGHIAIHLQRRA